MFDVERFLEACRAAVIAADAERALRELLAEAVSDRSAVIAALPPPEHAGITPLFRDAKLTVLDMAWAPWMTFKPHNHEMWSCVGIYIGREDNIFWRRAGDRVEAAGARTVGEGEVVVLGRDVIHSVVNPIGKLTRAIHVYAGDFFDPPTPRSEWSPETLRERPWDLDDARQRFANAEARARANGEWS
jgi:predicted metal-dependent enzyme (double-stranded beta helix superfamily)